MNPLKILIADDEIKSLENLKQALSSYDWITETAENGDDALKKLETSHYDVLLTDLNMQKMDGMELISRARAENSSLVIIMITAYEGHLIRKRAFALGANGFFNKPIDFANLASSISKGLERIKNNNKRRGFTRGVKINKSSRSAHPPYVAVMLAMSTGGPQTIQTIFDALRHPFHSVIFLVQHSPAWALKTLAEHLDKSYDFKVQLAADGIIPEVNQVYIAPGDKHLYINPKTFACQ
ncbi:MAG: response regulator, partial [Nitrospinales bacterium]